MRKSPFIWTEERVAVLEKLYRVEGRRSEAVGAVLGCSAKAVVRKAGELGWGAERRQRRHEARVSPYYGKQRRLRAAVLRSDAELIAEAMAAGRVRVLPTGMAAGLTSWERAIGFAAPPPGVEFNGPRCAPRIGSARAADLEARAAA